MYLLSHLVLVGSASQRARARNQLYCFFALDPAAELDSFSVFWLRSRSVAAFVSIARNCHWNLAGYRNGRRS